MGEKCSVFREKRKKDNAIFISQAISPAVPLLKSPDFTAAVASSWANRREIIDTKGKDTLDIIFERL